MRFLIIANPISGPRASRGKAHNKVALALLEAGHEVLLRITQYPGHATELACEAIANDVDVVCVVGGDGTVNEVARSLIGTDITLAIIPNGSGNGLARELSIPLSLPAAIKTLLQHNDLTIDTCLVNNIPFLCTCGIGFDGSVSEEFSESSVRGPMVYIKDVVQVFFSQTPACYTLDIDGDKLETKAFLIAFGNAAQYGNNAFIAPKANLTDGIIDITIIRDFPMVDAAQIAIQLFSKGLAQSPYARLLRGRNIRVTTPEPIPFHIDGEAMGSASEIEVSVRPQSLKVLSGTFKADDRDTADFFRSITNNLIGWHNGLLNKLGMRNFDD